MTEWQINIPYRDRSDSMVDVADAAAEALDGEEREVVQRLAFDALARGVTNAGRLLDELESVGPEGRRELLDQARAGCGLLPTLRQEQRDEYVRANAALAAADQVERDEQGRGFQSCPAKGCSAFPVTATGQLALTNVRRWWCSRHEHLAAEGDMEPWSPRIRYSQSGALLFGGEQEAERARGKAEAESRRHRQEAREAERREEAAVLKEFEAAKDERWRRESPLHNMPKP